MVAPRPARWSINRRDIRASDPQVYPFWSPADLQQRRPPAMPRRTKDGSITADPHNLDRLARLDKLGHSLSPAGSRCVVGWNLFEKSGKNTLNWSEKNNQSSFSKAIEPELISLPNKFTLTFFRLVNIYKLCRDRTRKPILSSGPRVEHSNYWVTESAVLLAAIPQYISCDVDSRLNYKLRRHICLRRFRRWLWIFDL